MQLTVLYRQQVDIPLLEEVHLVNVVLAPGGEVLLPGPELSVAAHPHVQLVPAPRGRGRLNGCGADAR